ncbi:MAG: GNAT family N-acetyltransferase [Oscillospiraceae bacterium]|nr:GNAT family N-acetyltransferase [Oscillospiraceae bacterium]
MSIIFTTERLTIRKFEPDDYNDLADILTDKAVTYFEPYETFTREACIQEAIDFSESEEFFAVVLSDKVIGKIYISQRKYGSYEIGYTFNAEYQGMGYAYESVKGMIKYAFNDMKIRRIFAEINTRNFKSVNLAQRLGLRKEAEHIEVCPRKEDSSIYDSFYVYALLRKEFEKLQGDNNHGRN